MGRHVQQLELRVNVSASASTASLDFLNFGSFEAEWGCYSPSDVVKAQQIVGANCGPASFAAICRVPVMEAMRFFPHFPAKDWTTLGHMRGALQAASIEFVDFGSALPEYGLALLQLHLNDRPLHGLFSLAHTHWVGVCRGCFYDVNWQGWLPIPIWQELVLAQLKIGMRPVKGWAVRNGMAVLKQQLLQTSFGYGRIGEVPQRISA